MLATLAEPRAPGPDWIYEPKLDGVRTLVRVGPEGVQLYSRNRNRIDRSFPEVAAEVGERVPGIGFFDGEIVAMDPDTGRSSFSRIQQRLHRDDPSPHLTADVPVQLWLFDCLHYEGRDLTARPWTVRREVLERAVRWGDGVVLTGVLEGRFSTLFRDACAAGEEGLIAKRRSSAYRAGRSRDWLKLKCVREQELLVVGWTDPQGSRVGFGALLLGYYEGETLRYAGKVGTGFDIHAVVDLYPELQRRVRSTAPLPPDEAALAGRDAHWTDPTIVVQVGFAEWTPDGILRHPRYLGRRIDIEPADVRVESPVR